jgi:hypothetical protein
LLDSAPVGDEDVVGLERELAHVAAELERSELVSGGFLRKVGLIGTGCELLSRLLVVMRPVGAPEDPKKFENQVAKHWMSVVK